MADQEPEGPAGEHAPGWLFRLNTTLGARHNTPAWMGAVAGEGTSAADAAPPGVEPAPGLPPLRQRQA